MANSVLSSTPSKNSRFLNTPLVIDPTTNIERYIEWQPPDYGVIQPKLYVVKLSDIYRVDLISNNNYGACDLWWLILNYNGICDPFSLDVGDRLIIPDVATVNQVLSVQLAQTAQLLTNPTPEAVPVIRYYATPPYSRPILPTEVTPNSQTNQDNTLFVYGFRVPTGLTGNVQFQLVASPNADFSDPVLNKFTLASQVRWFFYNPSANSGSGGYQAFPSTGIDGELYVGQTVYYNIADSDGLAPGFEYYVRYRTWIANVEGPWQVSPPIVIPN